MFRSFGKPFNLEEALESSRKSNTNENDTQVEVSLDVFDKLYSIIVTENSSLKSVVSVPTTETRQRNRINSIQSDRIKSSCRLTGSSRRLSPSMNNRSSTGDAFLGRGRGSHSCPPPNNRGGCGNELFILQHSGRHRDASCPPPQNREDVSGLTLNALSETVHPTAKPHARVNKKSKDLVSKMASRDHIKTSQNHRTLFGFVRKPSKIVPTPNVSIKFPR